MTPHQMKFLREARAIAATAGGRCTQHHQRYPDGTLVVSWTLDTTVWNPPDDWDGESLHPDDEKIVQQLDTLAKKYGTGGADVVDGRGGGDQPGNVVIELLDENGDEGGTVPPSIP